MRVFRDVVAPVLSAYLLVAGVVVYSALHPDAGRRRNDDTAFGGSVKLIVLTVLGGYCCFLGIVIVFHVWLVGDSTAMRSALRGGALLAAIALIAFVLASALEAGSRSLNLGLPRPLGRRSGLPPKR